MKKTNKNNAEPNRTITEEEFIKHLKKCHNISVLKEKQNGK
jgi:hypothetical protein